MKNLINKIKEYIVLGVIPAMIMGIFGILSLITIYGLCLPQDVSLTYEDKTLSKTAEAENYCNENNFNEDFCILIDMSVHSGKNRFRVYDFNQNKITHSYLVSHGCGENEWAWEGSKTNPTFSNIVDSHLSSLGKYAIGDRGWSSWGVNINYKLHGLEESNSNAHKRWIVFHSWDNIQDDEIYPYGTDEGWGCPAISNNNFKKLDQLLKNQTKPTLMWIYK